MRECHGGLDLGQVDFDNFIVNRIFVSLIDNRLAVAVLCHECQCLIVNLEDTVLGTSFDCHVGHGQTVAHGQRSHALASEFHRAVQSTVYADLANDVQDHVLAGDVWVQLALENKLDSRRHLEPSLADRHAACHIGRADTGRECTQCTVCAGVRVCTDNNVTGNDQSFFRKQGMFDTHLTNVIEVGNLLFAAEIAAHFTLCGSLDVLVRGKVIHDHGHLVLIENVVLVQLVEFPNCNGGSDVVAQYPIQIDQDQLTGFDRIQAGVCSKDLLCHCHTHRVSSSFVYCFL